MLIVYPRESHAKVETMLDLLYLLNPADDDKFQAEMLNPNFIAGTDYVSLAPKWALREEFNRTLQEFAWNFRGWEWPMM
jgi:hypothetical protein